MSGREIAAALNAIRDLDEFITDGEAAEARLRQEANQAMRMREERILRSRAEMEARRAMEAREARRPTDDGRKKPSTSRDFNPWTTDYPKTNKGTMKSDEITRARRMFQTDTPTTSPRRNQSGWFQIQYKTSN